MIFSLEELANGPKKVGAPFKEKLAHSLAPNNAIRIRICWLKEEII
jgi:hypothetical protein